jgi:hypothetical protein
MADLDQLTTEVFNAVHASEAYEPVFDFIEVEGEMPYAVRDWKTIRQALEKMPQDVIVELCKMRGALNIARTLMRDL